jgi:hypothetical protein
MTLIIHRYLVSGLRTSGAIRLLHPTYLHVVVAVSHVIYLHLFYPRFPFLRLRFFPVWMYHYLNQRYQINISEKRQNLPHSVWNCNKTYGNLLPFFSPHTEISRLILSLNNWCCWLNSVCAVRLTAFGLWWMCSFASQGQASSVNRFRFDDVGLLCCVLPCTGNQTVLIKLGFKLVYLLLTCYDQVLYLWLYVTMKTVIMI